MYANMREKYTDIEMCLSKVEFRRGFGQSINYNVAFNVVFVQFPQCVDHLAIKAPCHSEKF